MQAKLGAVSLNTPSASHPSILPKVEF